MSIRFFVCTICRGCGWLWYCIRPIGRHQTSWLSFMLLAIRFFFSSAAHGCIGRANPRPATSPKLDSGIPSGVVVGAGAAPAPTTTPDGIPLSSFGEVAGRGFALPMQPWAAELKKKRMANNMKDNQDVWCLPIGLMQYHNHPQPRQIVQTKNL